MAKPCCFQLSQSSARISDSLHGEATRLLDGSEQLVVQLVVVLVGRNVDPVETANTRGERSLTQRSSLQLFPLGMSRC